ncbi:MAG: cation:proton antiporter [Acidimicrobiales bacterium]
MEPEPLLVLAGVAAVGVVAQWAAWRLRVPSILVLLVVGAALGASGWLDPDELLGDLLFPVVSLSVALILFEGSLGLGRRDLRAAGTTAVMLCTVGAGLTFGILWLAARAVLDIDRGIAALVAANLIVTGPTVIGPLLQQVRPRGRVGAVLRAEGIIIDPIGAAATIVVFELIVAGQLETAVADTIARLLVIGAAGVGAGLVGAALVGISLGRFLVPDHLRQPAIVATVLSTFAVADHLQHESGLVAVTVLGLIVANLRRVDVDAALEFAENLQVLVLSALFILLAARLDLDLVRRDLVGNLALLAVAVLVARPVAVALSTIGSGLTWRERAFLAAVAPRGIVAAAIASVFVLRLEEAGVAGSQRFAGAVITVLVGSILVYGIGSRWVAGRLGLTETAREGVLIVGAHEWGVRLSEVLQEHGLRTLLVDRDRAKVVMARQAGRDTVHGSILSPRVRDGLDLEGLGHVLAITSSAEVNALAVERLRGHFGRPNTWQLPTDDSAHLSGRPLAWPHHGTVEQRLAAGARIRATRISEQFDAADYRRRNPGAETLLLVRGGRIVLAEQGEKLEPRPGDIVVALAQPARPEPTPSDHSAEDNADDGAGDGAENRAASRADGRTVAAPTGDLELDGPVRAADRRDPDA